MNKIEKRIFIDVNKVEIPQEITLRDVINKVNELIEWKNSLTNKVMEGKMMEKIAKREGFNMWDMYDKLDELVEGYNEWKLSKRREK